MGRSNVQGDARDLPRMGLGGDSSWERPGRRKTEVQVAGAGIETMIKIVK